MIAYLKKHILTIERTANILVLIGSISILLMLSVEILGKIPVYDVVFIKKVQLWICIIFLIDFIIRLYSSEKKVRFFFHNLLFLIVSIPFMSIIDHWGITISGYTFLVIRVIPLIRGGYGIAIMIGWLTRSRITNLFISYLTTLIAVTYFSSIIFYSMEKAGNPMVKSFWDALWWACMDVTTVGSNIYATTPVGDVLSVLLAASGMMMFPIFTAYITSKFQDKKEAAKQ